MQVASVRRTYRALALLAVAGVLCGMATSVAPQPMETIAAVAQLSVRPEGAPQRSDICFSSRWKRPNSLEMAAAFQATRLDWLYERGDEAFVAEAKAKGYAVNCAVNSTLADSLTDATYTLGRALDLEGWPIVAPWMVKWGTAWGCSNHPDYRRIWLAHAKAAIDAGADSIQMDGPSMGAAAVHWGGCFCSACVDGFRQYVADHTTEEERAGWGIGDVAAFDYAAYLRGLGTETGIGYSAWKGTPELRVLFLDFQRESTLAFFRDVHAQLNEHAGREVPYSCNNADRILEYLHEVHDFGLVEWYPKHRGGPDALYRATIRPSESIGTPMVFTYVSTDVEATRRFIALTYAFGSQTIVPWDVYTSSDTPRVFAEPEQYADLYGFVRANAELLDGHEDAAVVGPGLEEDRYGPEPPVHIRGGSGEVYASVRCVPGEPSAPVAIHLVDTSDRPQPFTLVLDPRRFAGETPLRVELRVPAAYDAAASSAAEDARSYARLSARTPLGSGHRAEFEIPALGPWGIVVVTPDAAVGREVWQPTIWATDGAHYRSRLTVRMAVATEGAEIRYTTDGTAPTEASSLYTEPIQIADATRVAAQAFADREAGAVAGASFIRLAGVEPTTPDAGELRDRLRLWLRADTIAGEVEDGGSVPVWRAQAGPDALVPEGPLHDGEPAGPPTLVMEGIDGKPVVRFDGADDLLAIRDFARENLAGAAFTVLMVTASDDDSFGLCGNALNGGGGIPRLYLTRWSMIHDALQNATKVAAPTGVAAITSYAHDGDRTATTWVDGVLNHTRSDIPVVTEFGGGHLAFPFWSGSVPHAGDIAELIVLRGHVTDAEREGVEAYLADRYGIRHRKKWRSED